jgi:hypothetical protein
VSTSSAAKAEVGLGIRGNARAFRKKE